MSKTFICYVFIQFTVHIIVRQLARFMSPPPGGEIDIVFFGKVIGCTSGSKLPPLVSGEFFGPRVEKNMLKH